MTIRRRGSATLDVTGFGAKGDGTDATEAFARAIDALPRDGGTVYVPDGLYEIDPLAHDGRMRMGLQSTHGIRLRSNMRLLMAKGATLTTRPNSSPRSYLLLIDDGMENVEIEGGVIIGDRIKHTYAGASTHEWGYILYSYNARHVTIRDLTTREATGDGIGVHGEDFQLLNVKSLYNRRQGLTVGTIDRLVVRDSTFALTGRMLVNGDEMPGTKPLAGIDIEPDTGDATNLHFENLKLLGNQGSGITSYVKPRRASDPIPRSVLKNIIVKNCLADGNGLGFEAISCEDFHIIGGSSRNNYWTGVRFSATSSGSISGMTFSNNRTKNGPRPPRVPITIEGTNRVTGPDLDIDAEADVKVGMNRFE